MKTLVVNDTVSVPARTVKNHKMSPGKVLAEADPALCGFTECQRKEGHCRTATEAFSMLANSLHGLSNTLLPPGL